MGNMKMKEMKTWFKLPVNCMPSDVGGWMEHVNFGVKGLSSHHCEAIDDAINNHDRLVEENAELREALLGLLNCKGIHTSDKECVIKAKELLNK